MCCCIMAWMGAWHVLTVTRMSASQRPWKEHQSSTRYACVHDWTSCGVWKGEDLGIPFILDCGISSFRCSITSRRLCMLISLVFYIKRALSVYLAYEKASWALSHRAPLSAWWWSICCAQSGAQGLIFCCRKLGLHSINSNNFGERHTWKVMLIDCTWFCALLFGCLLLICNWAVLPSFALYYCVQFYLAPVLFVLPAH